MHAKVKGTKDTVSGLGIVPCNIGTGKKGQLPHLSVIIRLNSVPIFLSSFLNEMG